MTPGGLLSVIALLCVVASIGISVRTTKNLLNGYVIANLPPLVTLYIIPVVAPYFIDIELPLTPIVWTFAIFAQIGQVAGYLAGLRTPVSGSTPLPAIPIQRMKTLATVSFAAYAVTFAPLIAKAGIVAAFKDPRSEIYEVTRIGYGQFYSVSGSFLTLFCLLGLFAFQRKWLVVLVGAIASIPYGSKTRFVILANLLLVYGVFYHPIQRYLRHPIAVMTTGIILFALIPAAFWMTSHDIDLAELHEQVLGFGAEYQVNFGILTTQFASYFPDGFFGGRIYLEDNILAFAPRFIWSDKPQFFGSLHLSDTVFPVLTALEKGAPSFGPFGQPYADFGLFGIIQVVGERALGGYLLGRFESAVRPDDPRSYLCLYTVIVGGFVSPGGAINPLVTVLVNLVVIAVLFRILRYESSHQPAAMPS